ncbi:MAG TPA: hypothetical protein VER96_08410 [Polyangiaceae bacterium]|nr:hypothetical protein [Polyangiaceae bacterium]
MPDISQQIDSLQRLCSLSEPNADDVFNAGRLVMDLGHRDLRAFPRFDFRAASEKVRRLYRSLLDAQPGDARCLNDLSALLLSCGELKEGRSFALMALAAAPGIRTVHENLRIADFCCQISPLHEVPPLAPSEAFLLAYFDPHAH